MPSPGAYVKSTVDDQTDVPAPVCDDCLQRHYPQFVPTVEAARLHYWMH
jgi:hypothetical protein